jgi:hypothetical protein
VPATVIHVARGARNLSKYGWHRDGWREAAPCLRADNRTRITAEQKNNIPPSLALLHPRSLPPPSIFPLSLSPPSLLPPSLRSLHKDPMESATALLLLLWYKLKLRRIPTPAQVMASSCSEFKVGSRFRVQGLCFSIQGSGLRVHFLDSGFGVQDSGIRVQGSGTPGGLLGETPAD